MTRNHKLAKLEEVKENIDLACEFIDAMIKLGKYRDASFRIDEHIGIVSVLAHGAFTIDQLVRYEVDDER